MDLPITQAAIGLDSHTPHTPSGTSAPSIDPSSSDPFHLDASVIMASGPTRFDPRDMIPVSQMNESQFAPLPPAQQQQAAEAYIASQWPTNPTDPSSSNLVAFGSNPLPMNSTPQTYLQQQHHPTAFTSRANPIENPTGRSGEGNWQGPSSSPSLAGRRIASPPPPPQRGPFYPNSHRSPQQHHHHLAAGIGADQSVSYVDPTTLYACSIPGSGINASASRPPLGSTSSIPVRPAGIHQQSAADATRRRDQQLQQQQTVRSTTDWSMPPPRIRGGSGPTGNIRATSSASLVAPEARQIAHQQQSVPDSQPLSSAGSKVAASHPSNSHSNSTASEVGPSGSGVITQTDSTSSAEATTGAMVLVNGTTSVNQHDSMWESQASDLSFVPDADQSHILHDANQTGATSASLVHASGVSAGGDSNSVVLQNRTPWWKKETMQVGGATGIVYSNLMLLHKHPIDEHPEQPKRISKIYHVLQRHGCVARMVKVPTREVTKEEVLLVHEPGVWEGLEKTARE